jgi:hypothetical protein
LHRLYSLKMKMAIDDWLEKTLKEALWSEKLFECQILEAKESG